MLTKLLVSILIVGIFLGIAVFMLRPSGAELINTFTSPDNLIILEHCRSNTDTQWSHHAPYGDHVYLKPRGLLNESCSGDIIFAGGCRDLAITWPSERLMNINCTGSDIVTLATKIRGIDVKLKNHQSPPS